MLSSGAVAANPLYDPRHEHDACGLGFVARSGGERSHELVQQGIELLRCMHHRGATGSDPNTGDGAGIMLQIPDRFLRRVARRELELELPRPGDYAVAMCFLPRDPGLRMRCEELCVRIAAEEGQRPLGWRDVPVDPGAIGTLARESEPLTRQLLIARGRATGGDAFRRKLYVIRRRIELSAAARRIPDSAFFMASCSNTTLTYKGLLSASQLDNYYLDLREPDVESAIALVHSRFSTNTLGTWDLAHPFNYLAHNGEINTVRGNRQWLHAREPQLRSAALRDDLQKLFPIMDERWSDSAALDAAFELLVAAGRAPAHVLSMLMPVAWDGHKELPDHVRAFYEYHAALIEPWDGPAAVAFSDGRQVGAALDRSGLRPARYQITRDGLVVLASEVGALELDPADVIVNDRLTPGAMLIVDTERGLVQGDAELKDLLARRRPYRALLDEQKIYLEDVPEQPRRARRRAPLEIQQRTFGYTDEEVRLRSRRWQPTRRSPSRRWASTPRSRRSRRRPQLLSAYFKQQFAQVTNPPIDPQRETLVMSLRTSVGAHENVLDESPDHARRVAMTQPVLTPGDLDRLRALPRDRFRTVTLSTLFDPARRRPRARASARRPCAAGPRALVAERPSIIVLSDRGVTARGRADPGPARDRGRAQPPRARGLRARGAASSSSPASRARSCTSRSWSAIGAGAVSPYLAFDTSMRSPGPAISAR